MTLEDRPSPAPLTNSALQKKIDPFLPKLFKSAKNACKMDPKNVPAASRDVIVD
jgi:hypothetical protein